MRRLLNHNLAVLQRGECDFTGVAQFRESMHAGEKRTKSIRLHSVQTACDKIESTPMSVRFEVPTAADTKISVT
jgi:hypothetical protein